MKVSPVERRWYMRTDRQADRQTDRRTGMMKSLGAFREYAKASKKGSVNAVQKSSYWGLGSLAALLMKTLTEVSPVHCEHNTRYLNTT